MVAAPIARSASSLDGRVEAAADGTVTGWVWDAAAPGERLEVEVLVDGRVAATATADGFHRGLRELGVGDGRHMFCATLPAALGDGREHELAVRTVGPPGTAGLALTPVSPFPGYTLADDHAFAQTTFVVAGVAPARAERPLAAIAEETGVRLRDAGAAHVFVGDPGRLDLRRVQIDVKGDDFRLRLHPGTSLEDCQIIVRGHGCVVHVGSDVRLRHAILRIAGDRGQIVIGDQTTMEGGALLVHEDDLAIEIGRDCMLSREVFVRTSDSHAIVDVVTGDRVNPPGSVRLGDHVWLAAGAQIGKGVTIGAGSIVGQRAVVSRDIPGEVVVAGNPARVVRKGATWRRGLKARP